MRVSRVVVRAAALAAVASVAAIGAAVPASAEVAYSCSSYDERTATDKLPLPGVITVEPYYGNVSWYTPYLIDEDGNLSEIAVGDDYTDPIVSVWGNGTGCFGWDDYRNAWAVAPNGKIYTSNDFTTAPTANNYGDASNLPLNKPIVGMSPTSTGKGYWLVASDGGIFCYGDAQFFGSTGNIKLNKPIVGMSVTPSGRGYWLVATDGGIFSFGDAKFYGSTGNLVLNKPVMGMTSTPSGRGYWMVASDGGVFTFGDATFKGSTGGLSPAPQIAGMLPHGTGYTLVGNDGSLYSFQ